MRPAPNPALDDDRNDMSRKPPAQLAKLTIEHFRRPRSSADTSTSLAHTLVRAGIIEPPSWYAAASHVGPSPAPMRARKPKEIVFEEDALIRAYYAREPTAAFDAIDARTGAKTHYVRSFALRQLEVMRERKLNEREALEVVKSERDEERERFARAAKSGAPLDDADRVLTAPGDGNDTQSVLEKIQAKEEEAWMANVEDVKAKLESPGETSTPRPPRRRA